MDPATVQAFLSGALATYAASQSQAAQGLAPAATDQEAQGLFGFNPTKYDSIWWCRSRFMWCRLVGAGLEGRGHP